MQRDIVWAVPAENIKRATAAMSNIPADTDLIVLPEMFSTGFATEPDGIAESDNGSTLAWMKLTAKERNCAVAGSIAVQTSYTDSSPSGTFFHNRFYFVKPDGNVSFYDKHHLFTYGGEHLRYSAGEKRVIVEWRGVRFMLLVCYDLRFPMWNRNHEDYDAAIYVASWPTRRIGAWQTLLHARAIENQCYVLGVNRIGNDPACEYCGGSVIIDPYGNDIATCMLDTECEATAIIDMEALQAFRKKFPVLKDQDHL